MSDDPALLEHKFITSPMQLTEAERETLTLRYGQDEFLRRFQANVSHQLRNIKIAVPGRHRK